MTYSQISGHYVLNKQENETIQFDIEIRYESAKNIIVPPISFKSHKVLYRAKLLGVHSLAQNSKSFHQVLSYSYLLNQIQGLTEIPKFTIRYLLDSKEKYFEIKAFSLKEAKPESNQFWFILLPLLLALFAVFILKKKNKSQEKSLKVDLKTLWQSGKTTEFLCQALKDSSFSMEKSLLQEYYDQISFAGISLTNKQKSQIDKLFINNQVQNQCKEKEQEDQFLASVLED